VRNRTLPGAVPFGARHLTQLALALAAAVGCAPGGPLEPEDRGPVEIRIANESQFGFDRVEVGFPTGSVSYGALAPGESSEYRSVSRAYRYAYIEIEVDGEEFVRQPIDYVGETPLAAGKYTYRLDLAATGEFTLTFRQDE
jgi:hypothetical protein